MVTAWHGGKCNGHDRPGPLSQTEGTEGRKYNRKGGNERLQESDAEGTTQSATSKAGRREWDFSRKTQDGPDAGEKRKDTKKRTGELHAAGKHHVEPKDGIEVHPPKIGEGHIGHRADFGLLLGQIGRMPPERGPPPLETHRWYQANHGENAKARIGVDEYASQS